MGKAVFTTTTTTSPQKSLPFSKRSITETCLVYTGNETARWYGKHDRRKVDGKKRVRRKLSIVVIAAILLAEGIDRDD